MIKKINVSVICATHKGSSKLKNLIFSIFKNKVWPKEIVICGTSNSDLKYIKPGIISKLNVSFFKSSKKSQIYQRSIAINKSKSDYILQIDDDVTVDPNFFFNIKKYTKKKKIIDKQIISALILQKNNNLQAGSWNNIYKKYFVFRSILRFLNKGKKIKQYSILESGRCIPYIKNFNGKLEKNIFNAQWLCSTVLYHKSCRDKVKEVSQISKKAYYEDVLFSHQLYLKKYNLIIDKDIIGTHDNQPYTSISTYFKTLKTQLFLVNFFKKSKLFFTFDVLIFTFIHLIRDIYIGIKRLTNEI